MIAKKKKNQPKMVVTTDHNNHEKHARFKCLKTLIRDRGAVSVATFMREVVTTYYAVAEPFGANGDFITSPEISQMFGELIGLWAVTVWKNMGKPSPCHLVEFGPGRGTLMVDLLRAIRITPDFVAALNIHLVENSMRLAAIQHKVLHSSSYNLTWHNRFDTVPTGPLLVVANEFLDALPIRQFIRTSLGWRERLVGITPDNEGFQFVLGKINLRPPLSKAVLDSSPVGTLAESSSAVQAIIRVIARRLVRYGGAALFIDYGSVNSTSGESLQAVRHHAPHPVLDSLGKADLTAHVDFASATTAAQLTGATVHGPVCQGKWLRQLGIFYRAETLLQHANREQTNSIITAIHRLVDDNAMGQLLKVLGITHPDLLTLPGLEEK